ncbi:GAF domain-containing protein [Sphingomonas colocasiae]|uniref:GAF domain-containing protein n=1 Tax=Sphingomonas colocasiae TaxID=1848973 RepID=A0ABS7PXJ6_9SPHN|nr:GAF domain-containing protein [Sphingomonas colocasiae]MBY8824684.1 GAF domain-containing protein [Sphingomonas colocasiae]
MSVSLSDILDCFEGVIPSVIATSDGDGRPNISYLSQVFHVDDAHVALSNQFFSKTAANVTRSGRATLLAVDGRSGDQYLLDLVFVRSERTGTLFRRMAAHLDAISSQHGMESVMALRSADIFRVEQCRPVPSPGPAPPPRDDRSAPEQLTFGAALAAELAFESDPDRMLDIVLDRLTTLPGFTNLMILVPDGSAARLTTLASRGYGNTGVGSEIAFNEGVIGIAAATGVAVRISDMSRGHRMFQAARATSGLVAERHIPVPGLADPQSQLGVPMLSRGRLAGVLFAESPHRFAFTREDERMLVMVGAQLAGHLGAAEQEGGDISAPASGIEARRSPISATGSFHVRYFAFDDSLFIDDAYVIKGVPGRLLFHLLSIHAEQGRIDFTNRELRLDPRLRLPDFKDNLETRLILLRRRLDEREAPVRLARPERGRIRLELRGTPCLSVISDLSGL